MLILYSSFSSKVTCTGKEYRYYSKNIFFIFRKRLKQDVSVNYVQTCFYFFIHTVNICREGKENLRIGRTLTSFDEYMHFDEKYLGCNKLVQSSSFTTEKMVHFRPWRERKTWNMQHVHLVCFHFIFEAHVITLSNLN